MANFWDITKGILGGGLFSKSGRKAGSEFLFGSPEQREQVSNLTPEQMSLQQQLINAGINPGAGGAFGTSADYYRNLLSDNPADFQTFAAPEMRQFQQETIPGLAEQFAGMGSGGLSSSGFRNAAVGAGVDLSERLGAIRANLRQQGAHGLSNIGSMGLTPYTQWQTTQQATPGFLGQVAPSLAQAGLSYATGGMSNFGGGGTGGFGSTSPYGGMQRNISPEFAPYVRR